MPAVADNLTREFFLGFIKVHILHHAAQAPVYGIALIDELRRHGYALSPGTLYPVLHGLEAAGYLTRSERLVGGKVRKYYAITPEGRAALDEAKRRMHQLMEEVLEEHGPATLPEPATDAEEEDAMDDPIDQEAAQ
jgi:DNA-binding PadR family transcriptional regulator